MSNRSLTYEIEARTVIAPKAAVTNNDAQVGAIIDRANFDGLTFLLTTGTNDDTNATGTVLIEDGDDAALGDAAAVADAQLVGTESGAALGYADDGKTAKIGYTGVKRYVRLTYTPGGNTGNVFLSVVALLSGPSNAPKTTQKV